MTCLRAFVLIARCDGSETKVIVVTIQIIRTTIVLDTKENLLAAAYIYLHLCLMRCGAVYETCSWMT